MRARGSFQAVRQPFRSLRSAYRSLLRHECLLQPRKQIQLIIQIHPIANAIPITLRIHVTVVLQSMERIVSKIAHLIKHFL
jgi:hypothetical protein